MSKSKHNGTGPDEVVRDWGSDTLRLYMLFMGPPEADKIWDNAGISGISRFLHRAWRVLAGDERNAPKPRVDSSSEGDARPGDARGDRRRHQGRRSDLLQHGDQQADGAV